MHICLVGYFGYEAELVIVNVLYLVMKYEVETRYALFIAKLSICNIKSSYEALFLTGSKATYGAYIKLVCSTIITLTQNKLFTIQLA